jgi:hypothetical protein
MNFIVLSQTLLRRSELCNAHLLRIISVSLSTAAKSGKNARVTGKKTSAGADDPKADTENLLKFYQTIQEARK